MMLLDLGEWSAFGRAEVRAYIQDVSSGNPRLVGGSAMVFRNHLRPVDVYSYLVARFDRPNGIYDMFKSDDSDNLIQWSYLLKSGDTHIEVLGFAREIQVQTSEVVDRKGWEEFVRLLKKDFGRYGKEKHAVQSKLERWHVFQNKFAILADTCAELHAEISDGLDVPFNPVPFAPRREDWEATHDALRARADRIYAKCTQLSLITPVLAEAYLNLMFLVLRKPELRSDDTLAAEFRDRPIHQKLMSMHEVCQGLAAPLDAATGPYKRFMQIRAERNDLLHGNMDPVKNYVEEVSFDGKTPLHHSPGDQSVRYWEALEASAKPQEVIAAYEDTLLFLADIGRQLSPDTRRAMESISEENTPGFDLHRRICGVLFSGQISQFVHDKRVFDDDLEV